MIKVCNTINGIILFRVTRKTDLKALKKINFTPEGSKETRRQRARRNLGEVAEAVKKTKK